MMEKSGLRVAVVIPVKDDEASLLRALESLRAQVPPADEVVVVDDGSRVAVMASRLPPVHGLRVVRLDRSEGPGPARNRGILAANADFVAFLDADDEFLPGRVASIREFLTSHPECEAMYSDVWIVGRLGQKRRLQRPPEPGRSLFRAIVASPFITTSTVVVRREVLLDAGGFPTEEVASAFEDYVLWLQLAKTSRWCKLPAAQVLYWLSEPAWRKRRAPLADWHDRLETAVLAAVGRDSLLERLGRSTVAYMAAKRALQEGDRVSAALYWRAAFHHTPRRPKLWIMGLLLLSDTVSRGRLSRLRLLRQRYFSEYD